MPSTDTRAEIGPLQHAGFLEYQYRVNDGHDMPSSTLELATWRADMSTYIWRPWILKVDAALGLTETVNSTADAQRDGTLVTGAMRVNLFPRSHFPFRAYYEARDSRVDSELEAFDTRTQTLGFFQQYAPLSGGRFSIDYRQNDTEDIHEDGSVNTRNFNSENWQISASKSLGRNDLRLVSTFRDINRDASAEMESRTTLNLRHRFRTSPRFFIEDTTFFSDERIELNGSDLERRFLQFNGISTWRPDTGRPLLVTARGLMQAVESGPRGLTQRADTVIVTGGATYQLTPNTTLAGNIGVTVSNPEEGPDQTSVFQRARTTYRSTPIDLGQNQYRFGGSLEAGTRSDDRVFGSNAGNDEDAGRVRDVAASLNHSLSRSVGLPNNRQLQVNFSQELTAAEDSENRREQTIVNSVFATLSRHNGGTSSYVRLSATDRRLSGDREDTFQFANFQASMRTQLTRNRSWNGSVTMQYSRNMRTDPGLFDRENESLSYSANLNFMQRNLFNVRNLRFTSELRWLSNDFRSDNPFDNRLDIDPDRNDRIWRNRLEYRVGRLELRLHADVREVDDDMSNQLFFQIRRNYGAL